MDALEVVSVGVGASLQDGGRRGWKRFGVPPGGVMDPHAAAWANRLAGNPPDAPVLELALQGADLRVLSRCRFAVAGAEAGALLPAWRSQVLDVGARLHFSRNRAGLWTYVAVEGGFAGERLLGSVSAYPRGGIGRALARGERLAVADPSPPRHGGDAWAHGAARDYEGPPLLRLWPGPQRDWFDPEEWRCLLGAEWQVSNRSDRVGYRLEGARLNPPPRPLRSEPVLVGSVQVPPNGQPIVTMRDGPTVGGYPKIALVDEDSLSWLVQCRPGVRFQFAAAA